MSLINKYRPQTFAEVVGHPQQVKALQAAIAKKRSRAFLMIGPSGVGKTTLARIAATEAGAGAEHGDIQEIDAATHTGVDAMRAVTDLLSYRPIGGSKAKALIVDEAHALSKAASQALLKVLEEPPEWVYWFLCTTEPTRILPTLRTRCTKVNLRAVAFADIVDVLDDINAKEKLKVPEKIVDLAADMADGSVRQAISNLVEVAECRNLKEAEKVLEAAATSAEAHELAKALLWGNWKQAQGLLAKLGEAQPESVRYVVRAYVSKVVRGNQKEATCGRGVEILDAFNQPFYDHASLDLAVGRVLLS